jgi:hypothetical protein
VGPAHRTASTPPCVSMMSCAMLVARRSDSILGADKWLNCIGNPCLHTRERQDKNITTPESAKTRASPWCNAPIDPSHAGSESTCTSADNRLRQERVPVTASCQCLMSLPGTASVPVTASDTQTDLEGIARRDSVANGLLEISTPCTNARHIFVFIG